jgi:transcriptional regulator with XRE-family HTH domain
MYTQIKQLKEKRFKQASVAKQLGIHRKTVKRYWNMTAEEFEKAATLSKTKLLSEYEAIILDWLTKHPSMTSAQISDWLKEHYHEDFKERTICRFVIPRNYEAVEELPMGQQLQVDLGEKWMEAVDGGKVKVRFAIFVLSHSRSGYLTERRLYINLNVSVKPRPHIKQE